MWLTRSEREWLGHSTTVFCLLLSISFNGDSIFSLLLFPVSLSMLLEFFFYINLFCFFSVSSRSTITVYLVFHMSSLWSYFFLSFGHCPSWCCSEVLKWNKTLAEALPKARHSRDCLSFVMDYTVLTPSVVMMTFFKCNNMLLLCLVYDPVWSQMAFWRTVPSSAVPHALWVQIIVPAATKSFWPFLTQILHVISPSWQCWNSEWLDELLFKSAGTRHYVSCKQL